MTVFHVGMRVRVKEIYDDDIADYNEHLVGHCGTIITKDMCGTVGVDFGEHHTYLHDLGRRLTKDTGWFFAPESYCLLEQVIPEVFQDPKYKRLYE